MSRRFDNGRSFQQRTATAIMDVFRSQCQEIDRRRDRPEIGAGALPMTNVQSALVRAASRVR